MNVPRFDAWQKGRDPASNAHAVGAPCFIIAEAGVNHNGRLDLALELVDAARAAGADAVKFQTWITEKLVTPDAAIAAYQRENTGLEETQFAMLKALELSQDDFRHIKAHCDRSGILFLSTPDEEDSADFLESLDIPLFKIGSGEIDNLSYLRHVAAKGRPMILSTGTATLAEVLSAVGAIREAGNSSLAVLHCVSNYPADPAVCNLRALETLRKETGCPTGFSDHTPGILISLAAVALGACIIEKHLTLDKALPGPDHRCSLDPGEFKALVTGVREVESALGTGVKAPAAREYETRKIIRKTLVASRDLPAGIALTADDLMLRRASGGFPDAARNSLLGRRLTAAIPAGTVLESHMLEDSAF